MNTSCSPFDADRLLIPVDHALFAALPDELFLDGIGLRRKDEFHVTVLNRQAVADVRLQLAGQAAAMGPLLRARCRQLDWRWQATAAYWLLRHQPDEGPLAHSIVMLVDMPDANALRAWLNDHLGTRLEPIPEHVTLFTAGRDTGIGLANMDQFHARRVREIHRSELAVE